MYYRPLRKKRGLTPVAAAIFAVAWLVPPESLLTLSLLPRFLADASGLSATRVVFGLLRPGMNGGMDIIIQKIPDARACRNVSRISCSTAARADRGFMARSPSGSVNGRQGRFERPLAVRLRIAQQ